MDVWRRCGFVLRKSYNHLAPQLALLVCHYAHARQFKRMNKALSKLRSRVGRVWRDIERQLDRVSTQQRAQLQELLACTRPILEQHPKDKNKLYALNAPKSNAFPRAKPEPRKSLG